MHHHIWYGSHIANEFWFRDGVQHRGPAERHDSNHKPSKIGTDMDDRSEVVLTKVKTF